MKVIKHLLSILIKKKTGSTVRQSFSLSSRLSHMSCNGTHTHLGSTYFWGLKSWVEETLANFHVDWLKKKKKKEKGFRMRDKEIQRIKSEKSHIQRSNGAGVLVMLGIMLMKSLLKISPFPCHSPSSGQGRTIWTPGGRWGRPKNNQRGKHLIACLRRLELLRGWKKSWTGRSTWW